MRMLISSIAAVWLSVTGTSGLASLAGPLAAPALAAAAPAALVLLSSSEAKAQRRRAGPRGGHRAGVRSGGRHSVHRNVHRPANRPYAGRPEYRRDYRPAHHGHYSRRDVYHHSRPGYRGYYGYGAGVAAGALAVGTVVASLPGGCTGTSINGVYYQRCNGTWYAPQYAGSDVTYVVVEGPQ